MKSYSFSILFSALLTFSLSISRADVTINMENGAHGQNMEMTMKLGAGNMRVDAQTGSAIFIGAEKKMIVLMPQQKMYMVMPVPQGVNNTEGSKAKMPEIIKTGKKETINGFACEQLLLKFADKKNIEMWMSKQGPKMGDFLSNLSTLNSSSKSGISLDWLNLIATNPDFSTFPIRTINFDDNGAETGRMTVTSFNQDKLPASTFVPPSDYTEQKMPNIPGMSGADGASGLDMEALKKMRQQMKGGRMSPEQMEQLKKMAEEIQKGQQ